MMSENTALYHLRNHQQQMDADGVMVGVSRQALDETLTKYEQMAKAVMEAWDQWHSLNALLEPMPYHLGAMNIAVGVVEAATNKHPSEWTRESLAEWLGVNDVEQARLKFLADGGML